MLELTMDSDVVNVFKTPGKLKGKTPRTARKRNVPDARIVGLLYFYGCQPLTNTLAAQRCFLLEASRPA